MAKKVLVLGAGASHSYGFPLGGELRRRILGIGPYEAEHAGIIGSASEPIDVAKILEFRKAFEFSQMYSIDAFLGRRPEFAEIGKRCIAAVLLGCESVDELISTGSTRDHWYQYLFNQYSVNDWPDLSFKDISIVTFNYDRSLEHFLHIALSNTYAKSSEEVNKKLRGLRIVHVYGALSESLPDEDGYFAYDGAINPRKVELAAQKLVVIPEGRNDSPNLVKARNWLESADRIAFLGFGFDTINVERLAEGGACHSSVQRPNGTVIRNILGTRIGLFDGELTKALRVLAPNSFKPLASFFETNCTGMLRMTQFLSK